MPDCATRTKCAYQNASDRFIPMPLLAQRCDPTISLQQYFVVYRARLAALLPRVEKTIRDTCADKSLRVVPIASLGDGDDKLKRCIIIGTIVKKQTLRPSVLKQLAVEVNVVAQPVGTGYVCDDDSLTLEDDQQVIALNGAINVGEHVTGLIVGVSGQCKEGGRFTVEQVFYPAIAAQPPHRALASATAENICVLFISGLNMTTNEHSSASMMQSCALLVDYVTGAYSTHAANIARLIVAGNSIAHNIQDEKIDETARYITRNQELGSIESMKSVDAFLARLTPHVHVDLLPGEHDPTLSMMPQPPLHRVMLPNAGRHGDMLNLVTNPYEAVIGENACRMLVTSGSALLDVANNSTITEPLSLLEHTFCWQHMAPTAPDTLTKVDPFIIHNTPHIYVAGNQSKLQSKVVESTSGDRRTLLLTLPAFSTTRLAAVVNTRTLDVQVIDCNQMANA